MNLLRKKLASPSQSGKATTPTSKGEKTVPFVGAAAEKRLSVAATPPPPALLLRDNGFLMKKQDGNMKRDWKRRYVTLTHTQLVYYSTLNDYRGKDNGKSIDLRFCTVKTSGVSHRTQSTNFSIPRDSRQKNPCSTSLSCDVVVGTNSKPLMESSASSRTTIEPTISSPQVGSAAATCSRSCSFKISSNPIRRSGSESLGVDQFFLSPSSSANSPSTSKDEGSPLLTSPATSPMSPVGSEAELAQVPARLPQKPTSPDPESSTTKALVLRRNSSSPLSSTPLPKLFQFSENNVIASPAPAPTLRNRINSMSRERPKIRARSNTISSSRPVSATIKPIAKPKARDDLCPDSFEFKVVSLTGKSLAFEAFTEEEFESWTNSIKLQIQQCLEKSFSDKKKQTDKGVIKKIQAVAGNNICADCLQVDPEWASLNFGSLLCIECSAVHRNLGTHVSRVRSLSLDEWSPELVEIMLELGNKLLVSVYEGRLDEYDDHRLPVDATREDRESFIRRKYIDKAFLDHLPSACAVKSLFECLKDVVLSNNVKLAFHVLAYCDKPDLSKRLEGGSTVLHKAAEANATILTQLLVWNGADVSLRNDDGKSALDVSGSKCRDILTAGGA